MAGESDGIHGYLAWVDRAVAELDQQPSTAEAVEEVGLVGGCRSGGADLPAEPVAGDLALAKPGGLVEFGGFGSAVGGVVDRADAVEAIALFEVAAGGLSEVAFVPAPGGAAVLAYEGGHEVDVVLGVAYGQPPDRLAVAVRGEANGGHELAGDVRPLLVGQSPVGGVVADRTMPDGLLGRADGCPDRLFEQVGQAA